MGIEVDDGVVFVHAMESAVAVLRVPDAISGGVLEHVISHLRTSGCAARVLCGHARSATIQTNVRALTRINRQVTAEKAQEKPYGCLTSVPGGVPEGNSTLSFTNPQRMAIYRSTPARTDREAPYTFNSLSS